MGLSSRLPSVRLDRFGSVIGRGSPGGFWWGFAGDLPETLATLSLTNVNVVPAVYPSVFDLAP
jgi:hypothetical protein